MQLNIDLITGFMVGFELFDDEVWGRGFILDLGIFRFAVDFTGNKE